MTSLPPGWTKTRVLVSGLSNNFTAQLREPVSNVVLAHCVSVINGLAIVQVDGLNRNRVSTTDASGNVIQFDYLASNLNNTVATSSNGSPALPKDPNPGKTFSQVTIRLADLYGANAAYSSGLVSVELDLYSYVKH
jgi:hypothetical protein